MMADRVSSSGPLRNCVLAPRRSSALDSQPLIGHPACGPEVSDFDARRARLFSGSSAPISASSVGDTKSDTQDRYPSSMHRQKRRRKRMKRREFLKAGGVGLAASAVAAPAIAQSMPEVKWRYATSWPKSLDTLYGGCEFFCKRVAEVTDNRFQIQPFAGGELVPGLQVLDAVANGTVEIGNTALYYYWSKNPAFTFGTAVPFGLNTRQHISWLLWGGGQDMLNDLLKEYNCIGIPTGSTGAQMGGWFRKEIKSSDDLKGLKFRVGGFAGDHHCESRRRAAADRGGRYLPGVGEGHHRCRRMGRPL